MKIAHIISTTPYARSIREKTKLSSDPLGYFAHSQGFDNVEKIIELICLNCMLVNLKYRNRADTVDIIICISRSPNEFKSFSRSIKRSLIELGVNNANVMDRGRNEGWSYGGFSYAFEQIKFDYDWYFFSEDDLFVDSAGAVTVCRPGHLNGIIGIHNYFGRKWRPHFHCACTGFDRSVADKLIRLDIRLPFSDSCDDYRGIISEGEVGFTEIFYKNNISLYELPRALKFYEYMYDVMRGIRVSRYPSFVSRFIYRLVRFAIRIKQNGF